MKIFSLIAQSVEQCAVSAKVIGSSPIRALFEYETGTHIWK